MYTFHAPRLCSIPHWTEDNENKVGCEARSMMTMKSGAQRNKSYYFLHIRGKQTVQLLI
jgi:hypothetical protein